MWLQASTVKELFNVTIKKLHSVKNASLKENNVVYSVLVCIYSNLCIGKEIDLSREPKLISKIFEKKFVFLFQW